MSLNLTLDIQLSPTHELVTRTLNRFQTQLLHMARVWEVEAYLAYRPVRQKHQLDAEWLWRNSRRERGHLIFRITPSQLQRDTILVNVNSVDWPPLKDKIRITPTRQLDGLLGVLGSHIQTLIREELACQPNMPSHGAPNK